MMEKATEIWKMLDDLSEKDPNAYKKFIQNNIEKGKEYIHSEAKKLNITYTPSHSDFKAAFKIGATVTNNVEQTTQAALLVNTESTTRQKSLKEESIFVISIFGHEKVKDSSAAFDKLLKTYTGYTVHAPTQIDRIDYYISQIEGKNDFGSQKYFINVLVNAYLVDKILSKGDMAVQLLFSLVISEMNYLINNAAPIYQDQFKSFGAIKIDFDHHSLKRLNKYKSKYGSDIFSVEYEFRDAHSDLDKAPQSKTTPSKPQIITHENTQSAFDTKEDSIIKENNTAVKKPVIAVLNEDIQDDKIIADVKIERKT